MKTFKIFTIATLLLIAFFSCKKDDSEKNPDSIPSSSITKISDFPGLSRDGAVAFAINSYGYVGLGTNYPDFYPDFYKYNPSSDSWTKLADFGGVARRGAVSFVVGGIAYVGMGYGKNGSWGAMKDFWKYNAASDSWIQLNDFPSNTDYASCFVIDSKAYVIIDASYNNTLRYDPASDTWTAMTDFPGSSRNGAVALTVGSKGYFGTGYNDNNNVRLKDFWEYNPSSDSWIEKADFAGNARNYAIGFTLGNYGFVGTGTDNMGKYDDFWQYNASKNSWVTTGKYPAGKANSLVGFVIDDIAYIGTGSVGNGRAFYKFEYN